MRNYKTQNLTLTAMFIAIELLLFFVPFLGFIPIGPINATTLHIPVIIGGIVLGKNRGALLGLVFGLASLTNATINVTVASFLFSPFISGNILSAVLAIVPRIILGYVSGLFFATAQKIKPDFALNIPIAAVISTLVHSVMVLGLIYIIFGQSYADLINTDLSVVPLVLLGTFASNGIIEAIIAGIFATLVANPIIKYLRK